jgi:prefoldin alpha subunit
MGERSIKEEVMEELQELDSQIKQIQAHIEKIDEQIAELLSVGIILEELKKLNKGDEAMVPVANGIYVKTKIEDVEELMINVGSDITVSRTIPQVKELISKQEDELSDYRKKLVGNFKILIARAEEIQEKVKGNAGVQPGR